MKTILFNIFRFIKYSIIFPVSIIYFMFTKRTIRGGSSAFVYFFCLTRGYSNDFFSYLINLFNSKAKIDLKESKIAFSKEEETSFTNAMHSMKKNGFYIFDKKLSELQLEELNRFALNTLTYPRPLHAGDFIPEGERKVLFNPNQSNHKYVRYDYSSNDVIQNSVVQEIISDKGLLRFAQEYLGTEPYLDSAVMWWHLKGDIENPNEEAAQCYHFDLERFRWLKVFIYLNDVGEENGPHCFIKGTHISGKIPPQLLKRGYQRIYDEEVEKFFLKEDFIEFTGKKGTIIAEDTRGLHKGKVVTEGNRLILQVQFSNGLYGANFPTLRTEKSIPELLRAKKLYPKVYKLIEIGSGW